MFPIIPHHYLKTSTEPSRAASSNGPVATEDAESITLVTAHTDIPCDVISQDFQAELLIGRDREATTSNMTVTVRDGVLQPTHSHTACWIRALRLAGDCHSCNVLLHRGQHGSVHLQVIRPIGRGEELQLWFAEATLAALAIPFLTPLNIQGDKCYVCHSCGRSFETPNPLKVHLSLQCKQLDTTHLYTRLIRVKTETLAETNRYERQLSELQVGVRVTLKEESVSPTQDDVRTKPSTETSHMLTLEPSKLELRLERHRINPPSQSSEYKTTNKSTGQQPNGISSMRASAFKPYWKKNSVSQLHRSIRASKPDIGLDLQSPVNLLHTSTPHKMADSFKMAPLFLSTNEAAADLSSYFQQASQMETLVSNLGRSKQGHLCIYCGKMYSRKYGLKIHIRTHTGFKPLQCKFCCRAFGDPSNLNKHVRLHAEGTTPYKCDLCGKVLVRRRDLERHIKSRHCPDQSLIV